ncbi:MAG: hypothetical protein ACKO0Z_21560 [Betaproteobacteria bacterium]
MADMSEISKKLKSVGAWASGPYGPIGDNYERNSLPFEAADEIDNLEREVEQLRSRVAELEESEKSLKSSLNFYKTRCDLLQRMQSNMRDPERQVVCDILANGMLLDGSR